VIYSWRIFCPQSWCEHCSFHHRRSLW
jgi:hypothetical protein